MGNSSAQESNLSNNGKVIGLRKVTIAAGIGTFIDYYVFILAVYASSIIWPTLFFSPLGPSGGLAASIAAFGLGYLVRPLGAFIFGHIGDKLGRMSTLVLTLVITFIGVLGIGITPSYKSIGIIALILVIAFRGFQGIGLGGEWGGASSWVMEYYNRKGKRGYWGGLMQMSIAAGIGAASLAFALAYVFSPSFTYFFQTGWRIPFYLGALIIVIGAIIRIRMTESDLFKKFRSENKLVKRPSLAAMSGRNLGLIFLGAVSWFYLTAVTPIVAGSTFIGLTETYNLKSSATFGIPFLGFIFFVIGVGCLFGVATTLIGGVLSDKINRKKTFISGAILFLLLLYPYYSLVSTRVGYLILIGMIIIEAAQFIPFGAQPAWYTELFPTKIRYSGAGLMFQWGGFLTGVAAEVLALVIISAKTALIAFQYSIYLMAIVTVISIIALIFMPDKTDINLEY